MGKTKAFGNEHSCHHTASDFISRFMSWLHLLRLFLLSVSPSIKWDNLTTYRASQVALVVKNPPANAEDAGFIPGSVYQEEGMVNHFGLLAWQIPWTDESGGPQSRG